jgi:stage V sporulation protein G
MIQKRVIAEYRTELDRSQQPGYVSRYDDAYDDDVDAADYLPQERRPATPPLPKGTHIEPAESEVPPPHVLPPAPGTAAPQPDRRGEAEGRLDSGVGSIPSIPQISGSTLPGDESRAPGGRREFGAGIF